MKILSTLYQGVQNLLKPIDNVTNNANANFMLKVSAVAFAALLFLAVAPKAIIYSVVVGLSLVAAYDNRDKIKNSFENAFGSSNAL